MIVLSGHVSAFYLEVTKVLGPTIDHLGHYRITLHARGEKGCGRKLLLINQEPDEMTWRSCLGQKGSKQKRLEAVLDYLISGLDNEDLLNICSGLYQAGKSRGKEEARHGMRQMLGI